jgi:hypothetical protein
MQINILPKQFTGHFPDRPIMPGVLMIEAMAQLGKYARPYAQSVRTFMNLFFHLEHRALRIDLQILDLQSGFSSFYSSPLLMMNFIFYFLGGLICLQPPISEGEGQRLFFFTGVNGVRWGLIGL